MLFFQEHLDYEIVQSLNPEFNKAVVRVNVFKEHRQTIQVIGVLAFPIFCSWLLFFASVEVVLIFIMFILCGV